MIDHPIKIEELVASSSLRPQYIIRLVGQVIRISLETMKSVKALPHDYAPQTAR